MLKNTFSRIRFNFVVTVATVGVIAGIVGTLVGAGVSIALANESEAICDFSFSSSDYEDYVTIDPELGTIKYNLIQKSISKSSRDIDIKYSVGYKATFQSSYTNNAVYLKGNNASTGYKKLVKQYGIRDYKIRLIQVNLVNKTTGTLKLKVT